MLKERDAMKPRFLACCLSVVLFLCVQGCVGVVFNRETVRGSGSLSEETHTFTGIAGVRLSTIGELDIRLGDTEELRIEADDNLLQYFEAGMDGDTLEIGTRRGFNLRPSQKVRYTLTLKELDFIGLSSSGNAHAPALSADHFEISISSSGDLSLDGIDANALRVQISSSGDVDIGDAVADTQDIRISSSGDYRGESVRSGHVTVRLSSGGSARLWAAESLDATLSSSGAVYYRGDPEVSDSHSSSGRVRQIR